MPASSRAAARRALALLALLALAAAAEPAHALSTPRGRVMHDVSLGPLWVDASVDPSSGRASVEACVEHDPGVWPLDAEREPDGDWAVWVPAGPREADGSHKAKPTCGQEPPGEPPCVWRILQYFGLEAPCEGRSAEQRRGMDGALLRGVAWPSDRDGPDLVAPVVLQDGVGAPSAA